MIKDEDLFGFKKECLFHALQGNREWGSKIYETSKQSKQWCIAFWLIYVGFFVKEANSQITWLQIVIGVLGIFFFLALDLTAHYFIEIVAHEGLKIDKSLNLLPKMTKEELIE